MTVLNQIFGKQRQVNFNVDTGSFSVFNGKEIQKSNGNFYEFGEHTFALYVDFGILYFQWNDHRWDMTSSNLVIEYQHDFKMQTTMFAVNGLKIEYPAWWKNDPHFDPNLPELDEDEDYFGYIFSVKQNQRLQHNLTVAWG
jgi:hypothetical protein